MTHGGREGSELVQIFNKYFLNGPNILSLNDDCSWYRRGPKIKRFFQIGIIPFCERASSLKPTNVLNLECKVFDTIVTAKGLCYTFNSKTMSEIFKMSKIIESWNSVLIWKINLKLLIQMVMVHLTVFILQQMLLNLLQVKFHNFIKLLCFI